MRNGYAHKMSRSQKRAVVCASSILATGTFPDLRLHHRAAAFLGQKLGRPRDSIPQGTGSPAAAEAAYRFTENPRVNAPMLWDPIHDYGAKGLQELKLVLSVQGTTALMFPTLEATTGLGTMSHEKEEALLMHSALAIPEARCLAPWSGVSSCVLVSCHCLLHVGWGVVYCGRRWGDATATAPAGRVKHPWGGRFRSTLVESV